MSKSRFGGLSDNVTYLENAIVFPHTQDNTCGVRDAKGAFCEMSRGVMGPKRAAHPPAMPPVDELETLKGRYLYGGWLRAHFGHFLLESTARLWALDQYAGDIDGVIFTPFRSGGLRQARQRYGPFLDILTNNTPLKITRSPTRVEHLIVPDPGFGHDHRVLGSPRYRAHTRAAIARAVPAKGPTKLYVSRSALIDKRGGVFGEADIDTLMAANGYKVFHPQQYSLQEQLAHYRAARHLLALDGSALHMAAYALQPDARVGIIHRRRAPLLDGLAEQIKLFAGIKVHNFDYLLASWVDEKAKRVDFRSMGELDLNALQQALTETDFIRPSSPLPQQDIPALINSMQRGPMRRVEMG